MVKVTNLETGQTYEYEPNVTFPPFPFQTITGDPWEEDVDNFHESIIAMRNRCDVLLELNQHDDLAHLIPTILEDLYEDCQRLIDEYATD